MIPFLLPYVGGFMALWMLNWAFLSAVGFVLESMISLLTKEYIPCELAFFSLADFSHGCDP